jgi:hypothetical protein
MKRSKGVVALGVLIASWIPLEASAAPTPQAPAAEASERAPAASPADASVTADPGEPPAAASEVAAGTAAAGTAAAGTAAAGTAAAAPSTETKPKLDGASYTIRLRDLEARVDELKEQIRRSHTRLSLLSDTILSGGVGGARASIRFQNDMSGAFRLTRVLFVLDGAVQYNKQDDTGALSGQKEIPIFNGSIAPGDHTLQLLLRLRGHGYGVFSYLRGYQFEVKQSHSFSVTEGKEVGLDVIAWEKGGVTTPLEQRPAVRYLERLTEVVSPESVPASGPEAPIDAVPESRGKAAPSDPEPAAPSVPGAGE